MSDRLYGGTDVYERRDESYGCHYVLYLRSLTKKLKRGRDHNEYP